MHHSAGELAPVILLDKMTTAPMILIQIASLPL